MSDRVSRLAKMLASDNPKTRKLGHKFVCQLFKLKSASTEPQLAYNEILGICKGLYYSLWMQDKLLLQEDTSARIVKLISLTPSREIRVNFVTAMFETLAREWDNLDIWRTDKFMMLARDFFVQSLLQTKKRNMSTKALSNAVYEKLINTNINAAVDLKVYMCYVIKQELKTRKNIPLILHSFFKKTLFVLCKIPKGSDYCTQLIQLLVSLAKLIRSNRSLPRDDLSEEVLLLSGKELAYKKIFRRIAKILHVVKKAAPVGNEAFQTSGKTLSDSIENSPEIETQSKGKMRRAAKHKKNIQKEIVSEMPSDSLILASSTDGNTSQPGIITDLTDSPSPCQKKRRKRRNPEEDSQPNHFADENEQSPHSDVQGSSSISPPSKKRRRRNIKSKISGASQSIQLLEENINVPKMDKTVSIEKCTSLESGISSYIDPKSSLSCISPTSFKQSLLSDSISIAKSVSSAGDCRTVDESFIEDLIPSKKRVSFGKVFRKKFLSSRMITSKSTNITSIPNRGILRH